ncbi:MAG TPA: hypothetical protein VFE11_20360 [Dongiaceae bacterium]|nr:hypothetical protein [Dongiaceae bacterium]
MRHSDRLPSSSDLPTRLLASPLGSLVTRPWFDRAVLQIGLSAYLPLSRAWAAASVAEGSLDRFLAELPLRAISPRLEPSLRRALPRVAVLRDAHDEATRQWERAFFGAHDVPAERLVAIECARREASDAFMRARLAFLPLRLRGVLPAARFAISDRVAVEDRHGERLADIPAAYLPPEPLPAIAESRRVVGPRGIEYWLRFPSGDPAVGETAWAHVFEPEGIKDPPSIVYAHGLAVEAESFDGVVEDSPDIVRQGVRLVRIEAPWHNRRRAPGRYGGEPFLATPPMAPLDLFAAEVRELAVLIAWCRQNGSARVAVGGTSLGALASQLVATHCRFWPAACRPDVLFLATTTEDVGSLSFDSSIARLVRLPAAMAAAGWTRELCDRYRPLADPVGDPPLAREDIIMILGRTDDVTPFPQGLALARRWRIPAENLFLSQAGHFSAALELVRDQAPLHRLAERLFEGSGVKHQQAPKRRRARR